MLLHEEERLLTVGRRIRFVWGISGPEEGEIIEVHVGHLIVKPWEDCGILFCVPRREESKFEVVRDELEQLACAICHSELQEGEGLEE